MNIRDIYEKFDQIGCLTFATVNAQGEPETRIAHLRGYDQDGIYFMTMYTKDFYRHLKANGKVSICGLSANTHVGHDENGMPVFDGGYAIRMTGNVVEVPMADIKAKENPIFDLCIKDQQQYPAMVVFCISAGRGDIFDYDFELANRDHKLERIYFAYNGGKARYKGLYINPEACIGCGVCQKNCSFKAIDCQGKRYTINPKRCDECGDCYLRCPVGAISIHE